MNITFYTSEFTSRVSQISPTSVPRTLWTYYLEYLWFYQPGSWVARIAYSCRLLAILLSLPLIILGLLDIASYGIARTLGVIDDVKASTSDKSTVHMESPPSILLNGTASPSSESTFSDSDRESQIDHGLHNRIHSPLTDSTSTSVSSLPPVFYAEDKLSGVGVFSPSPSQPPSPTSSRRHLPLGDSPERLRYRVGKSVNEKSTAGEND